jgi:16S rRNA (cytidine1402-2'-O)-methyltransferase
VLARELTKKFEEHLEGTPAELLERLKNRSLKGEFVVLVGAEPALEPSHAEKAEPTPSAVNSEGDAE